MNVMKYINELKAERAGIDDAIAALERLAGSQPRRGRPPKWLGASTPARKRKPFSAETRRKMSASQKKRWAKAA